MRYGARLLIFVLTLMNADIYCMHNDIENSVEKLSSQSLSLKMILETVDDANCSVVTDSILASVSYTTKDGIFVTKYYDVYFKEEEEKLIQTFNDISHDELLRIVRDYVNPINEKKETNILKIRNSKYN